MLLQFFMATLYIDILKVEHAKEFTRTTKALASDISWPKCLVQLFVALEAEPRWAMDQTVVQIQADPWT